MKKSLTRRSSNRSIVRFLSMLAFVALGLALAGEVLAGQITCRRTIPTTQYWCATPTGTTTADYDAKCAEDGGTVAYPYGCRIPRGAMTCAGCGSTVVFNITPGTNFAAPDWGSDQLGTGTTCDIGYIDINLGPNLDTSTPCTYDPDGILDNEDDVDTTCSIRATSQCYQIAACSTKGKGAGTATFSSKCTDTNNGNNEAGTSGTIHVASENKDIDLSVIDAPKAECNSSTPSLPGNVLKKGEWGRAIFACDKFTPPDQWTLIGLTLRAQAGNVSEPNLLWTTNVLESAAATCSPKAFEGTGSCSSQGQLRFTISKDALEGLGLYATICDHPEFLLGGPPPNAKEAIKCEYDQNDDVEITFYKCNGDVYLASEVAFQAHIEDGAGNTVLSLACPIEKPNN